MMGARLKLLALIAIPLAPLLLAWTLFFHFPELAPRQTTNHGTLIQPPLRAEFLAPGLAPEMSPGLTKRPKWTLLHLGAASCSPDCAQLLYLSRQVVKGLGRRESQVQRLLVTPQPPDPAFRALLATDDPALQTLVADTAPLSALAESRPLLLMDPQGHIMMHYSLDKAGKPLLEDLKRLLR